jgi:hypothetical protein
VARKVARTKPGYLPAVRDDGRGEAIFKVPVPDQ